MFKMAPLGEVLQLHGFGNGISSAAVAEAIITGKNEKVLVGGHREYLYGIKRCVIRLGECFLLPILKGKAICSYHLLEPMTTLLDRTLKRVVIDIYQTEAWGISKRPFKVIRK